MAEMWQLPQCCHNLAARGVKKRGSRVENDPKNPHKTASWPKKRGNVELLWKLKPLVYIHSRRFYPLFPHLEKFFEKIFLKKFFNSFNRGNVETRVI